MLSGKIHTATITRCLVDYEGSLEIDPELLKEANIMPYEKILVANRNNGSRLETYAIPGKAGGRDFCLNGPAARLGKVGDVVTIKKSNLETKLIRLKDRSFFDVVNSKFKIN